MSEYLRPKVRTGGLSTRKIEDGIFRNPPTYTTLGGFTSASKYGQPKGNTVNPGPMSLERGGPGAQKGKPI